MSQRLRPLLILLAIAVPAFTAGFVAARVPLAPSAGCRTFPETGKQVCGAFLDYWNTHGGLAQQGYPISDPFPERSDLDGKVYVVQYFERAVFELHPENRPPYNVLLSQLGRFEFQRKYPNGAPNATPATPAADPWAALHRPLQIPTLAPGAPCPVSPAATVTAAFGPALGPGPVYAVAGADNLFAGEQALFPAPWLGRKVLWIATPAYTGPVLVRGRQLDGPNEVRFGSGPAPGAELQLDTAAASGSAPPWRDWPGYTRVRAPGCYAYQVDGSSFSTVIVFQAQVAPGS